ncbi:MAG TPA: hypothetical protein VHM88_16555, partial [Candidatus Acidoferrales bacterium]|nr:hypothetical protein [Candidatus Acidoferrales bacterium]
MFRRITAPMQKSQVAYSSAGSTLGATRGTSGRLLALFLFGAFAAPIGARTAAQAETEKAASPQGRVKVERYQIEVSFQPEKRFLQARASVTLRAEPGLAAIEFELNSHLQILEVADGQGRKLGFARSQRLGSPKLSVRLAEPSSAGALVMLTFTYEGALPVVAGALDYITKDGILLRDESRWYPAVDLAAFTQNEISI